MIRKKLINQFKEDQYKKILFYCLENIEEM